MIIAGGAGNGVSTTEVLDLVTKTVLSGPDMLKPRNHFHLLTLQPGDRTLALGGVYRDGSSIYPEEVEELVGGSWQEVGRLQVGRNDFGGVAVPSSLVCG